MKQSIIHIAVLTAVLGGCASTPKFLPNTEKAKAAIETAIRLEAKKPKGELVGTDLEKVTSLTLFRKQITDLKPLSELKGLKYLPLHQKL